MNYLDLFAGIGGFALGASWAGMQFNHHYYSEVDDYASRVYQLRFPEAIPLGDIRKIRGADLPQGDWILSGGFPCQDISAAGKGAGLAGSRSGLWYEYARLIGELRPRYAIMENVGALVGRGLDAVLGSLAQIGYDAEWQDIRASDVGAPHRRERIWIVAYPDSDHVPGGSKPRERIERPTQSPRSGSYRGESGHDVADATGNGREPRGAECERFKRQPGAIGGSCDVADASSAGVRGLPVQPGRSQLSNDDSLRSGESMADADGQGLEEREGLPGDDGAEQQAALGDSWWAVEPDVGRVAHGIPARVDRLRCLGNAIVPQIAKMIFEGITRGEEEW